MYLNRKNNVIIFYAWLPTNCTSQLGDPPSYT